MYTIARLGNHVKSLCLAFFDSCLIFLHVLCVVWFGRFLNIIVKDLFLVPSPKDYIQVYCNNLEMALYSLREHF